jgi:hypothetical protein
MQEYEMDPGTAGGVGFVMIIYIVLFVAIFAGMWKTFQKAGKPGWAAIVPIYNCIVMLEIAGKPLWWIILMFIPLVNLVIAIIVYHQISLAFRQGVGTTLLLLLLPFIGWPMLGFGNAQYQGSAGSAVPTA